MIEKERASRWDKKHKCHLSHKLCQPTFKTVGCFIYLCDVKMLSKKICLSLLFFAFAIVAHAQCSMCTKTAQQLGEKPAAGLNSGIIYLMLAPFAIIGVIAYRWWKSESGKSSN